MRLTLLKRSTLNRLAFIMLFSAYIALFLNVAWYRQVMAVMPLHTVHAALVFLSMPLVAFCFYKDCASLFRNNKKLIKGLSPSNSIVASLSWYKHHRLAGEDW